MSKKGVYPYDFMDSMEKFENKELNKIKEFYSTLNEEHISEKDYNHAKEVWNAFRIKTWESIMTCIYRVTYCC